MIKTLDIQTRPIVTWPGLMTPHEQRKRNRYGASPNSTRRMLRAEMIKLNGMDVFIQGAYRDDQIRLDGLPRAGAVPDHPGVILTYSVDGSTYQLPCDTFLSSEQNLRAIVLTLQRLRLIEETGVKTHGRQYQGFKQLTCGDGDAVSVIARFSGHTIDSIKIDEYHLKSAYRLACKATHPDHGGSKETFEEVQRAAKALGVKP